MPRMKTFRGHSANSQVTTSIELP